MRRSEHILSPAAFEINRDDLGAEFLGFERPRSSSAGRTSPVAEEAGLILGRSMAEGTEIGRPRNGLDRIITAIREASN
jgi:hypothetical protein